MTRRTIKFDCDDLGAVSKIGNVMTVEVSGVDVTDFLDAEMVVDELDHRDLLNAMDVGDVADWLRGQGYYAEEVDE